MKIIIYFFVFFAFAVLGVETCFFVQENGYRYSSLYRKRFGMAEFFGALASFLAVFCLQYILQSRIWGAVGGCFIALCYLFFRLLLPRKNKRNLTARLKRTACISALCCGGMACGMYMLGTHLLSVKALGSAIFALPVLLVYPVTLLSVCILSPLEKKVQKQFIRKAQEKLQANPNLVRIAITGSFGKTTVKHFLTAFLASNGGAFATPNSYNTPQGISRAINESYHGEKYAIMEFGAKRKGDIHTLCRLYSPQIGILTGVCAQHLATFQTLSNVMQAKGELQAEIEKANGIMFFSSDDARSRELYSHCSGQKYYCGMAISQTPITVTLLGVTAKGSRVRVCDGERMEEILLSLYGKHMVQDFALAACVARGLGVSFSDILAVAKGLKPPAHRMEVLQLPHCTVIDDSYNANSVGVREALSVLSCFNGRKVVITPGLVEMGNAAESENQALGTAIAEVADYVLISAKENAAALSQGLKAGGFPQEKYRVMGNGESLSQGIKAVVQSGDVLLFLNDLPDGYR